MIAPLWEHPAIAGKHVVSMTREYPSGRTLRVATCQCGWRESVDLHDDKGVDLDEEVYSHWQHVINCAERAP